MLLSLGTFMTKWYASVLVTITLVIAYIRQKLRIVQLMLKLPGPFAYPIIGNAYLATNHKSLVRLGQTAHQLYGPLVRAWVSMFPVVFVLEPNHIQKILSSSKHVEKMYFYKLMHTFLGEGLITSEGSRWRHHRKLIQPSFSLSILEGYIASFTNGSNILLDKIKQETQNQNNNNHSLNVTHFVNEIVVNVLKESILGIPFKNKMNETQKSTPFRQGKLDVQHRWVHPWLMLEPVYKLTNLAKHEAEQKKSLSTFTKQVIRERRRMKEEDKSQCFLDFLLQICDTNRDFSEDDSVDEICTFMLAGQDSVGSAIAFSLRLLAEHTKCQERAYEEQEEIFADSDRNPTAEDVKKMKYLEQCLRETLRLYPSVPIIARKLGEDVDIGSHILPEGLDVLISPFATHRLPQFFHEPEKFDPDRFSQKCVENRHPYSYIPFSAGPRNCIGYKFSMIEMKIIISTILRHYKLELVENKHEINLVYRITLRASGGLWVKFISRHHQL